ncbi:MAG: hypothetical protein JEZ07_00345 [Phycisphaerae bacterium]|nr:hypothetical protein [Phycisphaerae bacterium]
MMIELENDTRRDQETSWITCGDRTSNELKCQGVYFFRNAETGRVNEGYIGLAGAGSNNTVYTRIGMHFSGDLTSDNMLSRYADEEEYQIKNGLSSYSADDVKLQLNEIENNRDKWIEKHWKRWREKYLGEVLSTYMFVATEEDGVKLSKEQLEILEQALILSYPDSEPRPMRARQSSNLIPRFNDKVKIEAGQTPQDALRDALAKVYHDSVLRKYYLRCVQVVNNPKRYLNPVFLMTESGARGRIDQIQQLAGMRALMAKPSGEIIETPIKANFREGLNVLEYFSSTHGARKGLADTALKTADSGYLTRKLADVCQNVIVNIYDCGTLQGINKSAIYQGEQVAIPLREVIKGRVARDTIRNPITDETIVLENEVITNEKAKKIEDLGLDTIRVRSPMTCESPLGLCVNCYGLDMSTGRMVEEGLAVGTIAAQSIGEPGTQLTMRTFHTGGIAERAVMEHQLRTALAGVVKYHDLNAVDTIIEGGTKRLALKRNGEILILDHKGRELDRYRVPYGADIHVVEGQEVKASDPLFEWDPHSVPILSEATGVIRFQDIEEGETIRTEIEKGKKQRPIVIEHKGEKHPRIVIEDPDGNILDFHYLPAKARIQVEEGDEIKPGGMLAMQPRAISGTQDITGGLPRVTEVFEARKPKEPAAMAEISGQVELRGDKRRGKMTIIIRSDTGLEIEHHVPHDKHLLVHSGDYVIAGEPLTDGPLVPHDILRIRGEEALQDYLLREIQSVYRAQKQNINDKHIEIVINQMLHKVKCENPGDTDLLPGDVLDKFVFRRANDTVGTSLKISDPGDSDLKEGQIITKEELAKVNEPIVAIGGDEAVGKKCRPATGATMLLGITKASLSSESFVSAASFQETTRVLTEASISSKVDQLLGLKENVILGHLIPAGTAFKPYLGIKIQHNAKPPVPIELEIAEIEEYQSEEALAEKAVKEALGLTD